MTARAKATAGVRRRRSSESGGAMTGAWLWRLVLLWVLNGVCGNAQTVETFSFTNLNQDIPDGNASGLSDVRAVTSALASVSSVRIKLHVGGDFNGDLYAYVRQVHATGTNYVVLIN